MHGVRTLVQSAIHSWLIDVVRANAEGVTDADISPIKDPAVNRNTSFVTGFCDLKLYFLCKV